MTLLDRRGRGQTAYECDRDGTIGPVPPEACDGQPCTSIEHLRDGLRVPILAGDRPLGRLDIVDFAVPEEGARYAATVWIVARVAAMALAGVRAAHGLVPICAACKSIRDSSGTWHPLERWISSTSEVQLSHGLCPVCYAEAEREAGLDPEPVA